METTKAKKVNIKNSEKQSFEPNYCTLVQTPPRVFPPEVSPFREAMIIFTSKKWVNGTKLKYYFFNGETDGSPMSWKGGPLQEDKVRQAFGIWKGIGIGLEFEETNDRNEAQIRIGFQRGSGSWSLVGRDIIDITTSPNERTMNFGWDISSDIDTPLHEIGHTLGSPHEHQNPNSGIVWDEEAVYLSLSQPPNSWSRETTFHNIIRKLSVLEVDGSPHDPNSIMHYPFGAGLIKSPEPFRNGIRPAGGLSAKDKEYMLKFYPTFTDNDYAEVKAGESHPLNIKPGEQKNFTFRPTRSQKYRVQTFGKIDSVMVLFEKNGSEEIYLAGDDDSGTELNSMIYTRLLKDREYIIRVRLFYAETEDTGSLMLY